MKMNIWKKHPGMLVRGLLPVGLALAALYLMGCRSMQDAVNAQGTGKKVEYAASLDQMWAALPVALKNIELEISDVNAERHLIQAREPGSFLQAGAYVAIFVQPVNATNCVVEVVSKRTVAVDAFAGTYAKPIFRQLDKQFKAVGGDIPMYQ